MNREIKFRAWDIHGKKIVEWSDIWENKGYLYDFMNNVTGNLIPLEFTGLKDKNGKEIYEGDIAKSDMFIGKIVWWEYNSSFSFHFGHDNSANILEENCGAVLDGESGEVDCNDLKVIGNIYENPELL